MGLLDDAIREHLELKRRRGADPDEVARQEGEALGDPRSGEFAKPDGEPAEAEAAAAPEPVPAPVDEVPEYEPAPSPSPTPSRSPSSRPSPPRSRNRSHRSR